MTTAIEFRNVSWGAKDAAGSLDAVSLSVPAGQFLAVCGPAGAGKTTFLRLVAREIPPGSGAVCLFSRDIWLMSAEEAAGTVAMLSPAGRGPVSGVPPARRIRALIGRALMLRPRIVLLAGVRDDVDLRRQLGLLSGLREAGATLVAALEDARLAAALADRVVELDRGRVVADSAARAMTAQV